MLVLVPHKHRYWVEKGGRWEFFWISMHGAEALRIHREVLATTGPVFRLQAATIDHLADCAYRLVSGDGSTPARASAIAYEASMALYDDVFELHGNDLPENSVLRHVIDHIGAHLHLPLPVDELARLSGLSRAHFSRVFAAHEGMPPAEFVLHKRLDRAAKLLTMAADLSGEGCFRHVRLRRSQLLRQGVPARLRGQPDRIPHHRHVRQPRQPAGYPGQKLGR